MHDPIRLLVDVVPRYVEDAVVDGAHDDPAAPRMPGLGAAGPWRRWTAEISGKDAEALLAASPSGAPARTFLGALGRAHANETEERAWRTCVRPDGMLWAVLGLRGEEARFDRALRFIVCDVARRELAPTAREVTVIAATESLLRSPAFEPWGSPSWCPGAAAEMGAMLARTSPPGALAWVPGWVRLVAKTEEAAARACDVIRERIPWEAVAPFVGAPQAATPREVDCDYTEEVVCPHCGHVSGDSWELDGEDGEGFCDVCNASYRWIRHVSVAYSTRRA